MRCTPPSNAARSTRCWSSAATGLRVYTVAVASLPGARGDGQPVTTLIDLERHAPGALLRRPAGRLAAAEQTAAMASSRRSRTWCRASAAARPSSMSARARAVPAVAGRRAARERCRRDPRGLRLDRRPHPDLRDRRTQGAAQGRTRPDADRPRGQGHARRCRGLHAQREDQGIGRGGKEREETLEIRTLNNATRRPWRARARRPTWASSRRPSCACCSGAAHGSRNHRAGDRGAERARELRRGALAVEAAAAEEGREARAAAEAGQSRQVRRARERQRKR